MGEQVNIYKGASLTLSITIIDAKGNPYVLVDGERLIFGVKKRCDTETYEICKVVTEEIEGAYIVEFTHEDTDNLPSGKYVYDVGLESGDDFFKVIPPSPFVVQPTVTNWGDGE